MQKQKKVNKILLCILDGFATGKKNNPHNAYRLAKKPNLEKIFKDFPTTFLHASSTHVGLPKGQMGNSEVGHMTIGAGRVLKQAFVKINDELSDKTINIASKNVHLIGLFSKGGIHSHVSHLYKIVEKLEDKNIYLHVITDGRDCGITDSLKELRNFQKKYPKVNIASISGRYFAMDRDKRHDRLEKFYNVLFAKSPYRFSNANDYIMQSHENKAFDEFIEPAQSIDFHGIDNDDEIVVFNFRNDRVRQLVDCLCSENFSHFKTTPVVQSKIHTLTDYFYNDKNFSKLSVIFENENIENTLSQVYSNHVLKQLKIAETEKYPHVTFFFNAQQEVALEEEKRILIQSPKVASYDLKPEMSIHELQARLVEEINTKVHDLIVCNVANCDMVGHTGNIEAAIKAVEHVDNFVANILSECQKNDYTLIITADHGNIDEMQDTKTSHVHTRHSMAKVPFTVCNKKYKLKKDKHLSLANIASTVLQIAGLQSSNEMVVSLLES